MRRLVSTQLLNEYEVAIARSCDVLTVDEFGVSRVPSEWVAKLRSYRDRNPQAGARQLLLAMLPEAAVS